MVEYGGIRRKPEGLRGKENASFLLLNISRAEVGHSTLLYTAMSAMRYEVTVHTHAQDNTLRQGRI